jgi:hypothetical protein
MINQKTDLKKYKFKLANLLDMANNKMSYVPELTKERHVPLTLADRAVLDGYLKIEKWRFVGLALFFGLFCSWAGWQINEWWGLFICISLVTLLALGAHSVLDIGVSLKKDIEKGEKTICLGQVYQTSRTYSKSPIFYLHLSPKIRLEITQEWYNRLELGQKVEVHVAPLSRLVLELKLRLEDEYYNVPHFLDSKLK